MRIQCENCQASYNIPDEKVQGRPFKFACKRCGAEVRYRPAEKPAGEGRMTMEISAVDVQPRTTGEMAAVGSDKTVFAPPRQAEVRQGPRRKAKYGEEDAPASSAAPRPTIEGRAFADLPAQPEGVWYLAYAKTKRGPMSVDEIGAHLLEIDLQGEIYVWKAGFENWKRIQEVPDFALVWQRATRPQVAASAPAAASAAARPAPARRPQPEPEPLSATAGRPRPTFTELLKNELGENEADSVKPKVSQKIDISELMGEKSAGPLFPAQAAASSASQTAIRRPVVIDEYVPAQKKKIPWVQIVILTLLPLLVIGTPMFLAYKHIIEIPAFEHLPLIGHHFKKEEVDHYAALREQWEALVKIDETMVALQATKEAEEQAVIAEEQAKAEAEKEERRQRAAQRQQAFARANPGGGGGGGGGGSVTTFDFGEGDDGLDLETRGELATTDIQRIQPLSQDEVNAIIRKNMGLIARCAQQQKSMGEALSGTMNMRFTISRRGSVVRAMVTSDAFKGSYVADCVAATIERIQFPRSGGSVTVSYPFSIQ